MRRIFLLIIPLLLASCFPLYNYRYNQSLQGFIGTRLEDVTPWLGQPTSNSGHYVIWNREWLDTIDGYYMTKYENVYTYDKKGKIIARTEVPYREWQEPRAVRRWCKTTAVLNDMEIILTINAEGNSCGSGW